MFFSFLFQSFFGRSYNNLNSITECKNNGECIINKKNRTACKSCRLRKCLLVGMSKSGSRYGRRSNWFKIHCLLQEQQQAAVAQMKGKPPSTSPLENSLPLLSPLAFPHPNIGNFLRPNNPSSPSVSSPDSDSSDPGIYSPRMNGGNPFVNKDFYLPVPFHSMFMQPPSLSSPFLLPPSLLPFPVTPTKHSEYSQRLLSPDNVQNARKTSSTPDLVEDNVRFDSPPSRHSPTNNNEYSSKYNNKTNCGDSLKNKCKNNCNNNNIVHKNNNIKNNNNEIEDDKVTARSKRFYLDAILGLKPSRDSNSRSPPIDVEDRSPKVFEEEQDNPIDLSIKSSNFKNEISFRDTRNQRQDEDQHQHEEEEEEEAEDMEEDIRPKIYASREEIKPIPLDLSV